jgi:hypothetical protein
MELSHGLDLKYLSEANMLAYATYREVVDSFGGGASERKLGH